MKGVRRVQLVLPIAPPAVARPERGGATVRGTLFRRVTGGHFTDVLVQVTVVEPGP